MKNRKILIGVLALFILATMVSGSLAIYQASINDIDDSFAAAKFVIDSDTNGGFFENILIVAPGDTVKSNFVIKNYTGSDITETDMKLDVTVTLDSEITPLNMWLEDSNGNKLGNGITGGEGTITYDSKTAVFTANVAKDVTYTVVCKWPEGTTSNGDIKFQGKSASFSIKVTGTQVIDTTAN